MNYAEIVDAVQDYTANDDATFVANIPELRSGRRASHLQRDRAARAQLPRDVVAYGEQPFPHDAGGFVDVQDLTRMSVGGTGAQDYLLQRVSFIRECYPNPATTGAPKDSSRCSARTR